MVTEQDVRNALPISGFVRDYVFHAAKQTTSPLCYHLGVGLTILAVTCPLDYGTFYAGPLRANMFTLLVGRSGEDQKSSALGVGRDLLHAAAAPLIGQQPASAEGLIDSLAQSPSQLIPFSEFGRFLAQAQRAAYFEPIKTLMADLWDSHAVQRARANGRNVRVDSPRLSIMAACSIPYLEKHTLTEDWTGGFMGRWAVLFGKRERINPFPVGDRTDHERLVAELVERATTPASGWCTGMDKQAKDLWKAWYYDLYTRKIPANVIGIKSRAPTIAMKVCLLYGWDFGTARDGAPWEISLQELVPALAFAELHIKSTIGLAGRIADHPDARLRRSVLHAIEEQGGEATLGQVLSCLKMRKRPVVESLDALLEEGRVGKTPTLNGFSYVLREVYAAG